MRATASPAPIRNGKRHLLTSCAIAAGTMALAYSGPALGQVSGSGSFASGTGSINNSVPNTTTVSVDGAQSIINWIPTDTSTATTDPIDFLQSGNTLNFSGSNGYTVLNRFVDGTGGALSRQIALNGTVNSVDTAASGARGGNIWFYNAGGILIGATGVINVGSLVLTSNDIITTGGLFGPGGTIRFDGTAGSTSAITVNGAINANNALNAGSAYVALVAPRVVQAGAVRVDGSAAYVAAEAVDIRINNGLFDINVTRGAEGGNVITHTGTTTGPAHQQGDIDQSRVYMVAIPKNDAVTMLVSGAIGYDDALSAQVDPDGAVRLSAGYNITAGELNDAPVNTAAANITAGDTLFRSNTLAHASGVFAALPTQTVPGAPPPLSSAGQFFVEGDGAFVGDAGASVTIGTGQQGGATGALAIRASGVADALTGNSQGATARLTITGGSFTAAAVTVEANGVGATGASGNGGNGTGGTASFTQTGGAVDVDDMVVSADGFGGIVQGQSGAGFGGSATINLVGGTITAADIAATADGNGGEGSSGNDEDPLNIIPGGLGGIGRGGTAAINIEGSAVVGASVIEARAAGAGGTGGEFFNFSSFGGVPGTPGAGGDGIGGDAAVNVRGGTTTASGMVANASGIGGAGGSSFFSSSSGAATGVGVGGRGGAGRGGIATIALETPISGIGSANGIARGTGGVGGNHNVGGDGGDGFGGIAQAIVAGFEAGELAVTLDSTGTGGNGANGDDGAGGNGGNGAGGTSRMVAGGTGASLTALESNFISDGTGGDGGAGGLAFAATPTVAPSGGDGGNGQGGAVEIIASEGGAVTLGILTGDSVFLNSAGRGGTGGSGSNGGFFGNSTGGGGGNGGGASGGTILLLANGGTITSNGEAVDITVNGISGESGVGGTGAGTGGNGTNGGLNGTSGGRVAIETAAGASGPGQIDLGATSITANGDIAGRIEIRAGGDIAFAGLDAEALGFAAPTNNDTEEALAGLFIAPTGGTISSQGDVNLVTDGSVGIYAQSNGIFDVDGGLTIAAGDQIDIRHEFREGAAPTVRASDSLIATAVTSISAAPGSLLGSADLLSLTASGPTGTIGVDRLDGNDITLSSLGATSVEHAEAVNDFTATVGSFRTGLNSIMAGGDIDIASPGTVDLGNSSAGGYVFVDGQSIAFNAIDAGTFVALRANGFGANDGVAGANITAGNLVSLSGGGVAVSGTIEAGDGLSVTATRRDAAIGLANATGNISIFAAGNMTGTYRAGGNVNLNADGNITAEADAAGGYADPSSGFVSEGYVFADAEGDATLTNSSAATMIGIRSGGAAALSGASGGEDIFVFAGTTANLTSVTARDDIAVEAVGGITISGAETTGAGPDSRSVIYAAGASSPVPFLQIQDSAADLSNVTLLALNAPIVAADVSAFDNLIVTGGTIAASGPVSAGGNIVANATGAVDLNDAAAGGFVQVQGQSIAFNSITAGRTVGLLAGGTTAGAEGIRGGSIAAGEDINLFANSIALTGNVTGGASFFAFGTGGAVSVNDADVDGTISIFSAADLSGTYVAGGNIFLNSNANINASARANGGYVDGNGLTAEGNLFVIAAGNAALTDSSAARMFGVNAGTAASINGGTAGEDVLVIAGTTASLTDVTGGDDITVRATDTIDALNVRTTGAGTDTRILDFSAASGSPTFTIGTGEGSQGIDGADIVMASSAGAIDAATLSAGDDILLNAANSIAVIGATTLGLGTTGGDSSIRTQGGATTLAGLDSFSDVVVDAAGLANLTGVVAAGRNATLTAQDVTLAALTDNGGTTIATLSADGDVVVNSAAGIDGGGVRARGNATLTAANAIDISSIEGQDVALTAVDGIAVDDAYVLGTTNLDSSDGAIQIGSLVASDLINASANAIRIEGGGNMHFATLTTDVGDAYVRGGGDFSVAEGNVAGTADLATQGEAMTIGNLTAANAVIANTGGFLNLDTVTVAGDLDASAQSSLGINGVVTGQAISLASANIGITPTGRVGTAGVTQSVSVANNDSANQTFVGGAAGSNGPNGYHIDADELTRLYGTQIEIFAPEVQAASGGSVGSAAPLDVVVDSFTMTGGAAGSNLGANGALTIRTPGKMRVIGNVQLTGLTDANALNLFAGDALEVILGRGTVRLVNGANAAGRLNMASDDIIVATQAAITAVGAATTTNAIDARLGENDGVVLDEGALFARGIGAQVAGGFYVQNSGAGTDFGQRRGLTFGAGGLDVVTTGPSRIVINGVQLGANGQITGIDVIPALTIGGAAPVTGGFDPRSTFNGCFIANPTACATVTVDFENNFPVQDVIQEEVEGDDEGKGDGNNLPQALITMRDLDPLTGEPLLDDPVTGAGNDDLWTPPAQ